MSRIALLAAAVLAASPGSFAQEGTPASPRPRVGLVLGGGGAKGAAHIGVLRVLEELHVPVDCVAGTSMGALVGATFASGMPPEEIERSVRAINWSRTVGSEGVRDRRPIQKKLGGVTYTNSLDLGVSGGRIKAPGGLLRTQDIEDVLRGLVGDAQFTEDFDRLPLPFRAVATDMLAGEMVVLSRGDLTVAMRASMAVPGAFSPVLLDGRVLSDGGMMRNLPVDIARALCADVVVAVSLSSPSPVAEDLLSAVSLAGRSLDVMIDANQKAQLATLTERDVSIIVPMGDIGSASFDRVRDAIPLGYEAARAKSAELRRYAVPEPEYLAWQERVSRPGAGATNRLAAVNVHGLDRVNPDYVRSQLVMAQPGNEVTRADIVEDTGRLYALGDFEKVEYRLSGPTNARTLDITPIEKSWGPDFVRFDLGLAANGEGTIEALLRADHNRTWINSRGGEWHSTLQIGHQTLLETEFHQPLDVPQRWFVQPAVRFEQVLEDIYDDGERVARYFNREGFLQLDSGVNLGTRAQLRAGIRTGLIETVRDTGLTFLPEFDRAGDSGVQARVIYDTRDTIGLPTRGTFLNARYVNSGRFLGGDQRYQLAEGVLTKSWPFRGDALTLTMGGGTELGGTLTPHEEFQLGGIRTFPGLQRGGLRGDSYWYAGSTYNWKIADIQSLFGQALYAGLRLQAGRVGGRIDDVSDGTLYGIAGSVGGRTPIGPFLLSLGFVDNDEWQIQFGLGRPIPEGSMLDETR